MAENTGKTKGAMIAAIQSAQMAVGSALKGGQASMAGAGGDSPQTVMLLEDLREIGRENERNTQSVFSILQNMFVFDKDAARRLRDQQAELLKEKGKPAAPSLVQNVKEGKEKLGMPKLLMLGAGLTALAAFMKAINMDAILRLPTQVASIKGIATFVSGVTKLGTLGLGAKFIDSATDSLKLFKTNFIARLDDLKLLAKNKFAAIKFPVFTGLADQIKKLNFVTHIKESKAFKSAVTALKGIKTGIAGVVTPMVAAFQGVFGGGAAAGPAGRGAAQGIKALFKPLTAIGKVIGKLFLPITIIMGIFDGYQGFMDEFEKEGSILDGIRGAVTGIVDGFIGGLVRLVTNAIGWMLEKLGFKHMATVIKDFGEDVTACFKEAVGGLVDFVTGIFTLDLDRITTGLKNLVGGTANFLFRIITTPIDLAIGFVRDLFDWGKPNEKFTISGFLFGDADTGEKGVVMEVIDWFKGLFSLDGIKEKFDDIKAKFFDMGRMAKAVTQASLAFTAAGWPGGESPTEAYKRVYDEVMSGGGGGGNGDEVTTTDGVPIAKTSATDVKGNTTETTYKTTTINEGASGTGTTPIIITDSSVKQTITPLSQRFETNVGSLSTSTDGKRYNSSGSSTFRLKRSDRKLKEDIKLEGKSPSGVNIYSFKYKGEEGRYKGVMAQETLKAAIFNIPGYLMVDYSKLDVKFAKIA